MSTLLSLLLPLVIVGLVIFFSVRNGQRKKALLTNGVPSLAHVLSISQTGSSVNSMPVMRLRLRIEQGGQAPREVKIRQVIDMGNMPRAGEEVAVMLDPAKPDNILYVGLTSSVAAEGAAAAGGKGASAMTAEQLHDTLSLPPVLRQSGQLRVGTILTSERTGTGLRMTVEVDSVVDPKYVVTIDQESAVSPFKAGERAYLLVDPNDAHSAALVPLSLLGGQKIDPRANRLDGMVLDPQLKEFGHRGTGVILSAEQTVLHSPVLAKMGMTRWHLKARITPEDGTMAYDAEQDITMTGPDKVAAMCVVGKQIPIRYDANDKKTWCTDAIAMGFPNPYKDKNMWDHYKALAAEMPATGS